MVESIDNNQKPTEGEEEEKQSEEQTQQKQDAMKMIESFGQLP